jgi:XTP/dITP diphosphohydrolase
VAARVLIATRSLAKARELRALLQLPGLELVSLDELGIAGEIPEDGETFDDNAVKKAVGYARLAGLPAIADDSGLEVDALGGAPGVRTRRFDGPDASDDENNAHLLRLLEGVPPEARTARYRCTLAFVEPPVAGSVIAQSLKHI